jgi:hypothetical protein
MKNFVSIMGSWAHEKLTLALADYEDVHTRLTTLNGFMELTEWVLEDVKGGDLQFAPALDLMSDILTDYYYRGNDCFGRTNEVGDLANRVDKLLSRIDYDCLA